MNHWAALGAAILAEVLATSALKASGSFTRLWPSAAVVTGYVLAFLFLSVAIRSIPIGVAYAVWSGIGIVLVTAAGWLLYGQRLDGPALAGLGLIVAGVAVLRLFSRTAGG